jgi:hypothetical protein
MYQSKDRRFLGREVSVGGYALEALEGRLLLSSGRLGQIDLHVPGICVCAGCLPRQFDDAQLAMPFELPAPLGETVPVAQVPALNSLPGAPYTLFLDFNGAPAFDWEQDGSSDRAHGPGGTNDPIPAFSLDSDVTTFSDDELDAIREMWRHVAEKFTPFSVNVTTVDPGVYPDYQVARVIIGGSKDDWVNEEIGGKARIGGFTNPQRSTTSFVFSADAIGGWDSPTISFGTRHWIGEVVAHEAGHTFGLVHQRSGAAPNTIEYYDGAGLASPIMGNSANINNRLGRWWRTNMEPNQMSPDAVQDELAFLYNLLGGRPDDHEPGNSNPTWLTSDNQGGLTGSGIIGSALDIDGFRFTSAGQRVTFTVRNAAEGGMLTPRVELRTIPGNQLVAATITNGTNGTFSRLEASNLVVGQQYALNVRSDVAYGSLGQYTVTGQMQAFAQLSGGILTVTGYDDPNNFDDIGFGWWFHNGQWQIYVDLAINNGPNYAALLFPAEQVISINVNTHAGNDRVHFWDPIPLKPFHVNMGAGNNSLTMWGTPDNNLFDVNSTRVRLSTPQTFYPVNYSNVGTIILRGSGGTNTYNVDGVAAGLTIYGGSGSDTVNVRPRDASGASSFTGNISFFGGSGADALVINDSNSASGTTWTLNNAFTSTTQNFSFPGSPYIGTSNDVQNITIQGSQGDDTFNLHSWRNGSALAVYGNGGDDTFNMVPTSRNLSANLTSMSAFNYDGGTGNDTFNLFNDNNGSAWSYTRTDTGLQGHITAGGYSVNFPQQNVETLMVSAGPQADSVWVEYVPLGTELIVNAGGGWDTMTIGRMVSMGSYSIGGVQGRIVYNAGADGGRVRLLNNFGSGARTIHLDQTSLSAWPGDDLFGGNGSLEFSGLSDSGANPGMDLQFGRGSDTIFAQPLVGASVVMSGGGGTDTLNLALAGVTNYAISSTGVGAGNVTSSNRKTLSWSSIEEGPVVDDVPPSVTGSSFQYNGPQQAIPIQFSEDVSASLGVQHLVLNNLTTGEPVPPSQMAMSYDTATNTATFTFPGFANGILPDGVYEAVLSDAVADLFGNALASAHQLGFFVLAGDANRDGVVNIADLGILAANWQQAGRSFSQGDYNYDGMVNIADLGILAANWQKSLDLTPLAGMQDSAVASADRGSTSARRATAPGRATPLAASPFSTQPIQNAWRDMPSVAKPWLDAMDEDEPVLAA